MGFCRTLLAGRRALRWRLASPLAVGFGLCATPAMADSGEISAVSILIAAVVALIGTAVLAIGLARLASGTASQKLKLGFLGGLGQMGGEGGAGNLRHAVSSILIGVMLLSVPDFLGVGIFGQLKTAYSNANSGPVANIAVRNGLKVEEPADAKPRIFRGPGGGGASGSGGYSFSIPWWIFSILGVFLVFALLMRLVADTSGPPSKTVAGKAAEGSLAGRIEVDLGIAGAGKAAGAGGRGGGGAEKPKPKGLVAQLFELMERIGKRMKILWQGLMGELRRLQDKSEGSKGRLRPIIAFASAQIGNVTTALRDKDDGGSNLPAAEAYVNEHIAVANANARLYLDRIAKSFSIGGQDPLGSLSSHLGVSKKGLAADLFRLGSAGAPTPMTRVVSADGTEWMLEEGKARSDLCRFSGVIKFGDIDWQQTLAVSRRDHNFGFVILAKENGSFYLVAARDKHASSLAIQLNDSEAPPESVRWCFVDIPLGYIRRHYGDASDNRWIFQPSARNGEALVFVLAQGQLVQIVSGVEHLDEAIAKDRGPVRALVGVMEKGALAQMNITPEDVVPEADE